ncbi:MAG: TSUP family transporter [Defluviitaleaceae bacterium]|nr:TSUP family transporter [Defluviitaleaceae bacterium]
MEYLHTLLYLGPLIFLAGFIDSIAGGGGTIGIPAYMLTGMPVHFALGTNKFSMTIGTAVAAGRFIKNKAVDFQTVAVSVIFALIGSALGALIALSISDRSIRLALIIILPCVAVFLAFRKGKVYEGDPESLSLRKKIVLATLVGSFMGIFDGLIGPGTGTFGIIAYNAFMKYDFRTASGNAKVVNLASNFGAFATFALHGNVIFILGIPAALCCIAGNYVGSGFALRKGAKLIRPMLFVVLGILLFRIVYDFASMG